MLSTLWASFDGATLFSLFDEELRFLSGIFNILSEQEFEVPAELKGIVQCNADLRRLGHMMTTKTQIKAVNH